MTTIFSSHRRIFVASLAANRNTGRANLEKARFFLRMAELAENADPFDQSVAEINLDAAIVFGKATQDWMGDRFGNAEAETDDQCGSRRRNAAKRWLKSTSLWDDPVCKFFADLRDLIVHEDGRAEVYAHETNHPLVAVGLIGFSAMAASLEVTPKNPTPEQLEMIAKQRELDFAERDRKLQEQQAALTRKQAVLQEEARLRANLNASENAIKVFFDSEDPAIRSRPAVQIVREYLDRLEEVLDAQAR
jgi:hypothetical protein